MSKNVQSRNNVHGWKHVEPSGPTSCDACDSPTLLAAPVQLTTGCMPLRPGPGGGLAPGVGPWEEAFRVVQGCTKGSETPKATGMEWHGNRLLRQLATKTLTGDLIDRASGRLLIMHAT